MVCPDCAHRKWISRAVAARVAEAGDEAAPDRVGAGCKDNRNGRSGCLSCHDARCASSRNGLYERRWCSPPHQSARVAGCTPPTPKKDSGRFVCVHGENLRHHLNSGKCRGAQVGDRGRNGRPPSDPWPPSMDAECRLANMSARVAAGRSGHCAEFWSERSAYVSDALLGLSFNGSL